MTNLEIYRFSLLNKAKEQQVLSFYNEEEDLLNTINDYLTYIFTNVRQYTDNQGKFRTFTLSSLQKIDNDNRSITGYFDSAYTGEKAKIKDRKTMDTKYDISKIDLVSKDFFFLIHVPKNSKYGILVVQKKENHGVKTVFENAFNAFMRFKGVSNYMLELKQAPARYLIRNFLSDGRLKEFRLIHSKVKSELDLNIGTEQRVIKLANSTNSEVIKGVLINLFDNFIPSEDRIPFLDQGEFDEIAFVLGYNGVVKTFYIKDKEKIRASVDVTKLVEFEDGEPTYDSLVKISYDLIGLVA